MKPGSKRWKQFMAKLYGIGASVVILGALFKIQHYPGASIMLIAGLGTEAIIFFFSAFEPPHEEVDWTLVYPELATGERREESPAEKGGSVTEQLDKMLEDAKIEPDLIASLGDGMRNLSTQASKLQDITDASVATEEYTSSLRGASEKVGELSNSYEKASQALTGLSDAQANGETTGEQLQKMGQNLQELNSVYETQLQELKNSSELYSGINELMTNLSESVEDTRKYKENISELASNLSQLNTVYGNMLAAMNVSRNA